MVKNGENGENCPTRLIIKMFTIFHHFALKFFLSILQKQNTIDHYSVGENGENGENC